MTAARPRWRGVAGGAALVLLVVLMVVAGGGGAPGSALSRDAAGWAVARAYLEAEDAEVTLADRPEALAAGDGVLVLALPFQRRVTRAELEAVSAHLRKGGVVVYGYASDRLDAAEEEVRSTLQLGSHPLREGPPLAPRRWWRYRRERWRLAPSAAGMPGLEVPAILSAPTALGTPRVLYRAAEAGDVPLVFDYPLQRGRVVALPAPLLSNRALASPGHADFLETLRRGLGDRWTFDELHHGRVAPELARDTLATTRGWDLFVVHVGLFYLLALVALGRRFGPPWRETTAATGSTAAFLRSLGALHHSLGHHAAAAPVLVERAQQLDPAVVPRLAAAGLEVEAAEVRDAAGLVALSRKIAAAQRRP